MPPEAKETPLQDESPQLQEETLEEAKNNWLPPTEMAEKLNFKKPDTLKQMTSRAFQKKGGSAIALSCGGFQFEAKREINSNGKTKSGSVRVRLRDRA